MQNSNNLDIVGIIHVLLYFPSQVLKLSINFNSPHCLAVPEKEAGVKFYSIMRRRGNDVIIKPAIKIKRKKNAVIVLTNDSLPTH